MATERPWGQASCTLVDQSFRPDLNPSRQGRPPVNGYAVCMPASAHRASPYGITMALRAPRGSRFRGETWVRNERDPVPEVRGKP